MNPATNQTLSSCLTLLCKWFKQRDERHIIKTLVSARNLGYGDLEISIGF
jgi:hypothetical protein